MNDGGAEGSVPGACPGAPHRTEIFSSVLSLAFTSPFEMHSAASDNKEITDAAAVYSQGAAAFGSKPRR